MRPFRVLASVGCVLMAVSSCSGRSIDITKAVEVTDVTTGWYDAGIENGLNKLVPTVNFRLRNVSNVRVNNIQLNAVFRRVGETEEWGGSYKRVVDGNGLPPGASTDNVVLQSNLGYTSTEARSVMLSHSGFKDVHVKIFAKQGSAQWTPLGDWDIQRALIVRTSSQ